MVVKLHAYKTANPLYCLVINMYSDQTLKDNQYKIEIVIINTTASFNINLWDCSMNTSNQVMIYDLSYGSFDPSGPFVTFEALLLTREPSRNAIWTQHYGAVFGRGNILAMVSAPWLIGSSPYTAVASARSDR